MPASSVFDFRGDSQEEHKGGVPGARKRPKLGTGQSWVDHSDRTGRSGNQ